MNYGIKLIETVCDLIDRARIRSELIKAYRNAEISPDNFVDGYEVRYADSIGYSLGEILEIFYNNTFKYNESTRCDGYEKLINFLYALNVDVTDIVDELDEIANQDCFYDIEGNKIDDDDEIRMMKNLTTLFNLYEIVADNIGDEKEMNLWMFMNNCYPDSKRIKTILEFCGSDDVEEIWTEWLICSQRAL